MISSVAWLDGESADGERGWDLEEMLYLGYKISSRGLSILAPQHGAVGSLQKWYIVGDLVDCNVTLQKWCILGDFR